MNGEILKVGDLVRWPAGNSAKVPRLNHGVVVRVYTRDDGRLPLDDAYRLFADHDIRFSTGTKRGKHKAWYLVEGPPREGAGGSSKRQLFFPCPGRLEGLGHRLALGGERGFIGIQVTVRAKK